MQIPQTISIKEYLTRKGIEFRENGKELTTHCLLKDCDKDSKGIEAHLYFDAETSQFQCKKCGVEGNIFTLAKQLGDEVKDIALNPLPSRKTMKKQGNKVEFTPEIVNKCHTALTPEIRQYLNDRGITDELVNGFKLGTGHFYGKTWITIPIANQMGKYEFLKLRKLPNDNTNPVKYKNYPMGSKVSLYGIEDLKKEKWVVLCEGEFDRLILFKNGIPSICGTGGAETFKDEWIGHFAHLEKIYICYDNDDKGRDGADKVIKKLSKLEDLRIFKIDLPDRVGEKGDITDYFEKYNGNPDEFIKSAKEILNLDKFGRIVKIEKPFKETSFDEWKNVLKKNFPSLLFSAEMGLSIISQILIKEISNPFALVLVDVPSSGKTIAINFFDRIPELTYATDKFTPASFVSNASNVKKEDLKNIDLLPKLKYKMFLIRDLATIFSKRDDDLNECLGILTRVLDGEGLNTDTGVHGQRQYVGEYLFMILGASTPLPRKVWKMMGSLGSRLFFLNLGSKEKNEDELAEQITSSVCKEKEKTCRIATKNFLYTLWQKHPEGVDWDRSLDKKEYRLIIARCAKLLAKMRGVITAWKERYDNSLEYDHTPPVIEQPDRINQLFYNLCRGHALVCGRDQINSGDLKLIIELTIDSSTTNRAKLFRKLIKNNGKIMTTQVEHILNCSKPTALKEMEILKILGVCDITADCTSTIGNDEKTMSLTEDFMWFTSDECKQIRGLKIEPKQSTLS